MAGWYGMGERDSADRRTLDALENAFAQYRFNISGFCQPASFRMDMQCPSRYSTYSSISIFVSEYLHPTHKMAATIDDCSRVYLCVRVPHILDILISFLRLIAVASVYLFDKGCK